jgi:hypothetical protein
MYCLFCVVLCIICVYMCTELLPPGGCPIAVKYIIYIISYHMYHIASLIGCYQGNFIGFSQLLQANSAAVPQIRPLILPSTSFPVHESPIDAA